MPVDPQNFVPNEAWLLFQLNTAPVRTEADGDFNVLVIMDVATGVILGMEFIGSVAKEPTEFESRKLLALAESEAGQRAKSLFVDSRKKMAQMVAAANAMRIEVIPVAGNNLSPITQEAREGFAAHVSGRRMQ